MIRPDALPGGVLSTGDADQVAAVAGFLAAAKTGQITFHVKQGRVLQIDLHEVRRVAR